jgi:hypothetical protein
MPQGLLDVQSVSHGVRGVQKVAVDAVLRGNNRRGPLCLRRDGCRECGH